MTHITSLENIKKDFPFFSAQEKQIHYLDNAATTLKPKVVIDSMLEYYQKMTSNVHRGAYELSDKVTDRYESVRKQLQKFLGAKEAEEIIFTSGTTDSVNLVAQSLGDDCLQEGDEIVVTAMEHHANYVPWQVIAKKKKAHFKVIPLTKDNKIDLEAAKNIITKKTKIFAFSHVSNVLGYLNPVKELLDLAKEQGAYTFIDGAQYIPHFKVNLEELDCDFYTFSPHKIMGPTGIGVLYGKRQILEAMPPYQTGGNMISRVTQEKTSWNVLPNKFEAGTPSIAGVFGLGAALSYIEKIDRSTLLAHEKNLAKTLYDELSKRKNFLIHNKLDEESIGMISFSHKTIHPHDVAFIADSQQVCLRAGHLCAQPLMTVLGVPALSRASLYLYNDETDIEQFLKAMTLLEKTFM